MARVQDPQVPPLLAGRLGRLIQLTDPVSGSGLVAKIDPRANAADAPGESGPLAYFAHEAGRWFRAAWQSALPAPQRARFARARAADVVAGVFPPEYWRPAPLAEDVTELGRPPWVLPLRAPLDLDYFDARHRPSNCPIRSIGEAYPTPPGDGTPEHPAPGWAGACEDGMFRDYFQAQRRILFALPYTRAGNESRPVALRIETSIRAESSDRGDPVWFILLSRPTWWHGSEGPPEPPGEILHDWRRAHRTPVYLPAATPGGWAHTHRATIVRNATVGGALEQFGSYDRVWVRVATPPSSGVYFSRNEWARVRHDSQVSLYMGRTYRD